MHVDAYRLGSLDEVDALDLDSSLEEAVTVVEWGVGLVEGISDERIEITLNRPHGGLDESDLENIDAGSGTREVTLTAYGQRWADADFSFANSSN